MREEYRLDRIVFIPASIPPHKEVAGNVDASHRVHMVRRSIAHNEHFLCDDVEVKRGGVSYTIDTVEYVYENYGFEDRPSFILGSDLLKEILTWKNIEELSRKVHFIVLLREDVPTGRPVPGLHDFPSYELFKKRKIDITSSDIRERVKQGRSIRYLVADSVLQYIMRNRLYRD